MSFNSEENIKSYKNIQNNVLLLIRDIVDENRYLDDALLLVKLLDISKSYLSQDEELQFRVQEYTNNVLAKARNGDRFAKELVPKLVNSLASPVGIHIENNKTPNMIAKEMAEQIAAEMSKSEKINQKNS